VRLDGTVVWTKTEALIDVSFNGVAECSDGSIVAVGEGASSHGANNTAAVIARLLPS